jgi:hypothetical protein
VVSACGADDDAPPALSAPPDVAAPDASRGLVIVLPPAEGLSDAERTRVRLVVERAIETALPAPTAAAPAPELLEPVDSAALVDTVERAVRRVGAGGTVCVLGAGVWEQVAPVFALYPAARPCVLPHPDHEMGREDVPALRADVDLEQLGRELGVAARAAALGGTVVVVDGSDVMLDRRWFKGLESGAAGTPGTAAAPGVVHVVRSAQELLTMLDEQAALLEQGIVPGSPEALGGDADIAPVELPFRDDLPPARTLPPVEVVVLDASEESASLVVLLAERGIRVIAPRSLLLAAKTPPDTVVLSWRVRWDVPLAELLRRITSVEPGAGVANDALMLEPGPAYAGP